MSLRENEADARIAIDDLLRAAAWDPRDKSQVGTEILAGEPDRGPRFATRAEARPFDTHAPVYDLTAAAGAFGPDRVVGTATDEIGWMPVPGHHRLTRDHFVARVVGHSMEPTIRDGSHCLFRVDRGGSRDGKLVLVWHRGCSDPTLGGEFSIKRYRSTKVTAADGTWSHREIRLEPLNPDPAYQPLVFTPEAEGDVFCSRKCFERLFRVVLQGAFCGGLTRSWREANMKELLQEMEHQAKALAAPPRAE